ncbi:MAG: FtsX-like permease family protein [Hyphomicrobiaceae bacterium]|nr:FtsX-like permease family protein [Hyphomicrobiaceae bacterium]
MSTAETLPTTQRRTAPTLALPVRLAVRQLRSGLSGFVVFLLCLALGVMVIATVGMLARSLATGLERQGRYIIGGDIALARMHARATTAEREALGRIATLSETATMRAMARTKGGADQMLIELKSVDQSYPLVGQVTLAEQARLAPAIAGAGAAVEPILLERLGLKVGDDIEIGQATFTIRAVVEKEPDGIGDRLTYGPRVFVSLESLEKTALVAPGALVRWRYALALPEPASADDAALQSARDRLKTALPESGFTIADRSDPSPQVRKTLERLRQFLTLIGLTALIVGGVGVANAVGHFVDRRRRTIAAMRALGASSRQVVLTFLTQIMAMAALGVGIGLVGGSLVPVLLVSAFGDALPIAVESGVSAGALLTATGYGLLVALLFSLWPLSRAERISPAVLFRDEVGEVSGWPPRWAIAATLGLALTLALIAVLSADARLIALWFCLAVVVVFLVFIALGMAVTWVARRLPRPRRPELAIAIRSIAAPGGLARSVVLSLGLGLSLLVAVALTDVSLVAELQGKLPEDAPDYYVLDVKKSEIGGLRDVIAKAAPDALVKEAPMLRGRLVRLGERAVETIKAPPEAEWVLNGDRGITYAKDLPEGSKLVSGTWWAEGYDGPPLVSFEADLARMLDLKLGDKVTVNILGRNVEAKIASLRELDWDSLAINFVMVFSPNTLAGAPHNLLATIKLPAGTTLSQEAALARAMSRAFPTATAIRVRDAIDAFATVFAKVMTAIRVAGGVTLIAGALVLAGALATAQRRRVKEAVILRTLGATRGRILLAHALEYAILALATAGFAVALGSLAAWLALSQVIDVPFTFSVGAVVQTLALSAGLVLAFGALGTWQILRARPVPVLRSE